MISPERVIPNGLSDPEHSDLSRGESADFGVHPVETTPPEIIYQFLSETELIPVWQEITLASYAQHFREYSKIEWSESALEKMWSSVFVHLDKLLKFIAEFDPDSEKEVEVNIFVPGMGSARDVYLLALLYGNLQVFGSDITAEMLTEAGHRLSWPDIEQLADFLARIAPQNTYWIHQLQAAKKTLDDAKNKFDKVARLRDAQGSRTSAVTVIKIDDILQQIDDRVHLKQEDMRELGGHQDHFYDVILNVGNFPHLLKSELDQTILEMLSKVKPGGTLSWDLKIDPLLFEQPDQLGRVFMDTAIGAERYFNTHTMSEIENLQKRMAIQGYTVEIEREHVPHTDPHKPDFIRLKIVKPLLPQIAA